MAICFAFLAILAWGAHPWAHALGDPHGTDHAGCSLVNTTPRIGVDHAAGLTGEDLHGCLICAFSGQVDLAPSRLQTHAAAITSRVLLPAPDHRLELKPIVRTQPQRGPPSHV